MKVVMLACTQPTAEGLGHLIPMSDDNQPLATFGERLCEYAGRICYNSLSAFGMVNDFVSRRMRAGHMSIIEHGHAVFLVEDISQACLRQLTRHRLLSFSVESQRYCKVDEEAVVVPNSPLVEADHQFTLAYGAAWTAYNNLLSMGVPKEDARFVLPMASTTRLVVSGNFREWHHVLDMRLDPAAQWEIRQLSKLILAKLMTIAPSIFGDLEG